MENTGVVSVWVGKFDDEDQFFNYVEKSYDDDGANSGFITETDVEDYDEDFAEGAWFDPGNPEALAEVSYMESFSELLLPDLTGRPENAAYFIFDVATEPGPDEAQLKLLGVYPYQQS